MIKHTDGVLLKRDVVDGGQRFHSSGQTDSHGHSSHPVTVQKRDYTGHRHTGMLGERAPLNNKEQIDTRLN